MTLPQDFQDLLESDPRGKLATQHLARIDKYRQLASSARSVSLKFSLRQIRCHFQEHLQKRAQ